MSDILGVSEVKGDHENPFSDGKSEVNETYVSTNWYFINFFGVETRTVDFDTFLL